MIGKKKITVFVDRDGTINVNLPFPNVNKPEKLELIPRAAEGIKKLNDIGCRVIIVTNQAGINNPENDLTYKKYVEVTKRLRKLLRGAGASYDDEFCCPHTRNEKCACRKPLTGLFERAREKYTDIDFKRSFIIGDRSDDIVAGRRLQMTTILVRTGHGAATEKESGENCYEADYVVDDLYDAALKIKELNGYIMF